jgi:hypothetical protein
MMKPPVLLQTNLDNCGLDDWTNPLSAACHVASVEGTLAVSCRAK